MGLGPWAHRGLVARERAGHKRSHGLVVARCSATNDPMGWWPGSARPLNDPMDWADLGHWRIIASLASIIGSWGVYRPQATPWVGGWGVGAGHKRPPWGGGQGAGRPQAIPWVGGWGVAGHNYSYGLVAGERPGLKRPHGLADWHIGNHCIIGMNHWQLGKGPATSDPMGWWLGSGGRPQTSPPWGGGQGSRPATS